MIEIFDWLGDIVSGLGDAIGNAFGGISDKLIDGILNRIIQWIFTVIYDGIAEFFTMISGLGVEIFTLDWVNAVVKLFSLFGWTLFVVGLVVSAFDLAIEYQNGRASIHGTAINWIKGFMAASEVPRIAERFGLDTSVKFNMMSAVHMTSTAVNLVKSVAK